MISTTIYHRNHAITIEQRPMSAWSYCFTTRDGWGWAGIRGYASAARSTPEQAIEAAQQAIDQFDQEQLVRKVSNE